MSIELKSNCAVVGIEGVTEITGSNDLITSLSVDVIALFVLRVTSPPILIWVTEFLILLLSTIGERITIPSVSFVRAGIYSSTTSLNICKNLSKNLMKAL